MPRRGSSTARRVWRSPLFVVALLAVVVVVAAQVVRNLPDGTYVVEVDLTVSSGGTSELFVNAESGGPYRQTKASPGRQTLVHEGIEGPFRTLRVDPVAVSGASITIHAVRVLDSAGAAVEVFEQGDFSTWGVVNGAGVRVATDGLSYVSTDQDNSASAVVDISSGERRGAVVSTLGRWLRSTVGTMGLAIAMSAAFVLGWMLVRRRWAVALLIAGPAAVYVGARLAGSVFGVTPADHAFGNPGFVGRDTSYPTRFLVAAAGTVLVVAVIGAMAGHRLDRRVRGVVPGPPDVDAGVDAMVDVGVDESDGDADRRRPWRDRLRSTVVAPWCAILAVPLVVALAELPSANGVTAALRAPLASDWDQANLRSWDHFFARGLRPMGDFWYPYGNLIWLRTAVVGAVLDWWLEIACFALVARALWLLSRHRAAVVLSGAAVAAVYLQVYCGVRYLLPLAVVCWVAASRRGRPLERWASLVVVALTPFVAVDVGLYTLVGCIAAVTVDEVAARGTMGRARWRRLVLEAGVVIAGWLVFVLVGVIRGDAGATLSLVLDQRTTAAYVGALQSIRESIAGWPRPLLYVTPFALLGVSIARALWRAADPTVSRLCGALAGLGAIGVLVLAKQLIRPGIDGVLLVLSVLALVAALAVAWTDPALRRGAAGAFGLLLGLLWFQASTLGTTTVWREAVVGSPRRAIELAGAFTWNRDEVMLFHPTLGPEQLVNFPEEIAAAEAVRALSPTGRMFVLGDAQFLYPLTEAPPYWVVSMWELSPVGEQRRVIDLLTEEPPEVVVVDRLDRAFDGVPHLLRVPLIHQWVIDHYRLEASEGPYDLLVPREATDPIDWEYWREALGASIDLGRLPAAATGDGERCTPGDEACVTYLEVEMAPVDVPTTRAIDVRVAAGDFSLTMVQQPGDERLLVPLGRLWFWQPEDSAASVTVEGSTKESIFGVRGEVLF